MLKKFNGCVNEAEVYTMSIFGVVPNVGSYRATKYEFKFLFHAKTNIIRCEDFTIRMNALSLTNSKEVTKTNGESVSRSLFQLWMEYEAILMQKAKFIKDRDKWIEEPTLLVTRFEYANLFHTVIDWNSAYVSSKVNGLPNRPHLIFVDGHYMVCMISFVNLFHSLFQHSNVVGLRPMKI
ncbi:Beta-(1,2)-xylosyltransferase protein [Spatholobus suberectus]|nr:Beta-(1,2)-xylosyltransferase protein [Spatholobus suberectus]